MDSVEPRDGPVGLGGRIGRPRPITIVMYHAVSASVGPYAVTPMSFRRQMEVIAREYRVIGLREVSRELEDRVESERRVVLTFDDAFADFFETAFPILERLELASTVFVPTGSIGGYNDWDEETDDWCHRPVMNGEQLRRLHETGLVDIGSHTIDHVRMSELQPQEMRRQAADSKAALEDLLGSPVTSFAYPYGQLDDFSDASTRVLSEAGYRLAVTTHWGTRNSAQDVLRLRRIFFHETDGESEVRRKVEGWYDWLALKERAGSVVRRASRALGRGRRAAPVGRGRSDR